MYMSKEGSRTPDLIGVPGKIHSLTAKTPAIDSSCLFSYLEGDFYTRSFAKVPNEFSQKDKESVNGGVESSMATLAKYAPVPLNKVERNVKTEKINTASRSWFSTKLNSAKPLASSTTTPAAPYYSPIPSCNHPYYQSTLPYTHCVFYPLLPTPPFYSPQSTHSNEGVILHLIENIEKTVEDQSSCRMVQKYLEDIKKPSVVSKLFGKMIRNIGTYMNLPFGNYLCQKLFELLDESQLKAVIVGVRGQVVDICNNLHGTRSMQKLVQKAHQELKADILTLLKGNVCELSTNINGNHVVQQYLDLFNSPENNFIYSEVAANCLQIATHKHGCCVMQKCLDHASDRQKEELVEGIVELAQSLVRDQYGNYVVQYVIELQDLQVNAKIADKLAGSIIELSNEKFSSNVVEKCLEHNLSEKKAQIIEELLTVDSFVPILLNPYGNYVVQKALEQAVNKQKGQLLKRLKNDMRALKNSSKEFGQKIYNKLVKAYPCLQGGKHQNR